MRLAINTREDLHKESPAHALAEKNEMSAFLQLFEDRHQTFVRSKASRTWRTTSQWHYLTDEELVSSLSPDSTLRRAFGPMENTRFAVIQIDGTKSATAFQTLKNLHKQLKDLGAKPKSFYIEELETWQIYLFFCEPVKTAQATLLIRNWLNKNWFDVDSQAVTVFPSNDALQIPLQPTFTWLNDDLNPIVAATEMALQNAVSMFLQDLRTNAVLFEELEEILNKTNSLAISSADAQLEQVDEPCHDTPAVLTANSENLAETCSTAANVEAKTEVSPQPNIIDANIHSDMDYHQFSIQEIQDRRTIEPEYLESQIQPSTKDIGPMTQKDVTTNLHDVQRSSLNQPRSTTFPPSNGEDVSSGTPESRWSQTKFVNTLDLDPFRADYMTSQLPCSTNTFIPDDRTEISQNEFIVPSNGADPAFLDDRTTESSNLVDLLNKQVGTEIAKSSDSSDRTSVRSDGETGTSGKNDLLPHSFVYNLPADDPTDPPDDLASHFNEKTAASPLQDVSASDLQGPPALQEASDYPPSDLLLDNVQTNSLPTSESGPDTQLNQTASTTKPHSLTSKPSLTDPHKLDRTAISILADTEEGDTSDPAEHCSFAVTTEPESQKYTPFQLVDPTSQFVPTPELRNPPDGFSPETDIKQLKQLTGDQAQTQTEISAGSDLEGLRSHPVEKLVNLSSKLISPQTMLLIEGEASDDRAPPNQKVAAKSKKTSSPATSSSSRDGPAGKKISPKPLSTLNSEWDSFEQLTLPFGINSS